MVQSGACSQLDFREVFKKNVELRVRRLPEIDGLSKETVLTSWLAKFDCIMKGTGDEETKRPSRMQQQSLISEMILSKEQLYDMFQQILGIKKFEHQLLFNALLLDSADEQAAAIRRELDGRLTKVNEMEKVKCHRLDFFFSFPSRFLLLLFTRTFLFILFILLFVEPQAHAEIPPERNGVALHRGTQVVYQSADG